MKTGFKRVPAIDKCFGILDLLAKSKGPLGISDISKALNFNRSTVFNSIYTLVDHGILAKKDQNKFHFGTRLYALSRAAIKRSDLIQTIHPYLEAINRKTRLMVFLGIRSGARAVIVDKVDSTLDIKVMSEVGMGIPLLAGAGGKALLAQLSDEEIDKILSKNELKKFTPFSCTDKRKYKTMIQKTRKTGIAFDMEEYIEDIRAFAVPVNLNRDDTVAAIWVVGLKNQIKSEQVESYVKYLKGIVRKIEIQFSAL
jgi:IclR family KDG regulon transcriptional repressor